MDDARQLYLDLMKKVLTNTIYGDVDVRTITPQGFLKKTLVGVVESRGLQVVKSRGFDAKARHEGRDRPSNAHTMVGMKRLDNLQFCIEDVLAHDVPGDFIETGVWRGGATIFMRAVLKAHSVTDRTVWVADSFEGLPAPDADKYPSDAGDKHHTVEELAISMEQVQDNFRQYDLLDDQVKFLKGWFKDTLPTAPIDKLAVARLDGDMYESTMDGLKALYPKLSLGGYLIVDDYGAVPGCAEAVHDYRKQHGIKEEIVQIDWTGVYWQRTA